MDGGEFRCLNFCCNPSRPHARTVKCLHVWLLVATAREI
jgi:predicted metal-binding transcription factor (methanogenesis marker protein 9)